METQSKYVHSLKHVTICPLKIIAAYKVLENKSFEKPLVTTVKKVTKTQNNLSNLTQLLEILDLHAHENYR